MASLAQQPESVEMRIANARPQIDAAETKLLEMMGRHGYSQAAQFAVRLAFEEGVVNAFRHGHKGLPKETAVDVSFTVGADRAVISITDQGKGFDPVDVPDCTLDENLQKTTGRGLMLIRSFMTSVEHELGGRRVVMTFTKGHGEEG